MNIRRFILVVVIVTFVVAVFGPILRGFGAPPDRSGDSSAVPTCPCSSSARPVNLLLRGDFHDRNDV